MLGGRGVVGDGHDYDYGRGSGPDQEDGKSFSDRLVEGVG